MNGNLTPEMLARIRAGTMNGSTYYDPASQTSYRPNESWSGNPDQQNPAPTGYLTSRASDKPGSHGEEYNLDGTFNRTTDWHNENDGGALWNAAFAAAMAGGIGFDAGLFGGGGAGAGASSAGGSGAFLGEGALSGVPAWDGALSAAQAGSLGAGGSLGAMGGSGSGAGGGMGGLGGAGAGVGGLSGIGSSLGGLSGLLGPAATLLGGALGSKGNKNTQTTQQTMDPRLDGAVYGANGQVPRAQGLLAQQMTPQAQQGYMDMQRQGMGLLSNPIAGNGFGKFSGR